MLTVNYNFQFKMGINLKLCEKSHFIFTRICIHPAVKILEFYFENFCYSMFKARSKELFLHAWKEFLRMINILIQLGP